MLGQASISRESLYRALSAEGNPSFATVLKVARALGVRRLVLETGIRQAAALALYRATGFRPVPLYGKYRLSPETSICLDMKLSMGASMTDVADRLGRPTERSTERSTGA